jgi:hypothetical protein
MPLGAHAPFIAGCDDGHGKPPPLLPLEPPSLPASLLPTDVPPPHATAATATVAVTVSQSEQRIASPELQDTSGR